MDAGSAEMYTAPGQLQRVPDLGISLSQGSLPHKPLDGAEAVVLPGAAEGLEYHAFSSDHLHTSALTPPPHVLESASLELHARELLAYPGDTYGVNV